MPITEKLTQGLAIVATVDPDATTAGAVNSDAVDMQKFNQAIFIVMAGTLGSSATLDMKLQDSDASGGTFTDITGFAITQLTQAGTDDSDKQAAIVIRADQLNADARYVRAVVTVGTATSDVAMIALGSDAVYKPASDYDLASVAELVSVSP